MNSTMNTNGSIPRTDVGASYLIALFAGFLLQLLDGKAFDFDLWAGVLGATLIFGAGYLPARHKNFIMSVVAVLSTLGAVFIGWLIYGQPLDNTVLSYGLSTLLVAGLGYYFPPNAQSEIIRRYSDPSGARDYREGMTGGAPQPRGPSSR